MSYYSLTSGKINKEQGSALSAEFSDGHTIGPVTVSQNNLFIKKGLRRYFIAYSEADRIFRRVRRLHANICCGDGDIEVEYLVISVNGNEIMEITLPGKKAARMLMDEIRQTAPDLDTAAPPRNDEDAGDEISDEKATSEADA